MQEYPMILSECEEINSLLYKPIAATQRIKYTCLNVSVNYIVLGSSSGSLYLFIREPCTFQQLIPLSEGPVSCVVISPDEKTIALATKGGSVCLIAVRPTVKLLAVSSEHLGEMITSLCWNDNSSEIYIGDGIGKISTMVLSIFTVNGMFQAPSCALMHLDSTIVQMEFSVHLLLVSTMTRCYICDTSQEQFKQIGNKARDGEFGACFLSNKSIEREKSPKSGRKEDKISSRKGTFNLISETNGEQKDDRGTKIYCARPGCRLWEVTTNGIVVKTHQFKDALAIPSSFVYRSNAMKNPQNRQSEQNWISQTSINFSHLYALCGKYLFSRTSGGLYVIDPTNAAIILWNNEYTNIAIARTINDKIYLMTDNGTFHCLRLTTPETLILEFYENKRYNECMRACKALKPDTLKSIIDENNHENDRESMKNLTLEQNDIMATLSPIITLIQSNVNSQPKKLNSGIVVVNAGNGKLRSDEIRNFGNGLKNNSNNETDNFRDTKIRDDDTMIVRDMDPVICENLVKKRERSETNDDNEIIRETQSCIDLMSNVSINDDFSKIETSNGEANFSIDKESLENENNSREIDDTTLKIQTDLNPVYKLINSFKPSMSETETKELIETVRKTMNDINENYGKINELKDFLYEILRSTERHYYNILLDNVTTRLLMKTRNEIIVNEILRAFVDTNISRTAECTACGFYYPEDNPREPKYLEIGKMLLEKFANDDERENCIKLCNSVTFMWRCYLPMCIEDFTIIDDIVCMCLRTRDNIVLSTILPMLDVRQWEIAVKFIKDMEMGICSRCGRNDENNRIKKWQIDWSGVARELMKREGTSSAMTFLVLIETVLPNVTLDKSIFQSLVFTKILNRHGLEQTVDFDRNRPGNNEYEAMCSPKIQEQLMESLEKDLERPIERNIFGIGAHHWGMLFKTKSSTCPCCTLSLQTPVLLGDNGISLFPCGHAYHVNCLIQKKLSRCELHS